MGSIECWEIIHIRVAAELAASQEGLSSIKLVTNSGETKLLSV
jgi:hypothetical protein